TLKNFLSAKSNLSAELTDLLVKAVKTNNSGYFLVFYQTGKPESTSLLAKAIKEQVKKGNAEAVAFPALDSIALNKWVLKKAKDYGADLPAAGGSLLVNLVGNDLWQLDSEILKLANYASGRTITSADINLLAKGKYNDNIFQLTDAISQKNKKQALKLFQDQLDSGANEFYLLTMLVREFRILWQVKDLSEKHLSVGEIAEATGISSYPVQKALGHCRQFTFEAIKKIFNRLLEIEIKLKTSGVSFEVLFDLLVAEL
ncbi:MAG: DNA polymerase III subunit delta, partial [Parcubacteria group bacterium]